MLTKKNTICLLAVVLLAWHGVVPLPLHATGVGPTVSVDGGAVFGEDNGSVMCVTLGCSLKLDRFPIYWSLTTGPLFCGGIPCDDIFFDITLTGDYWILNPAISSTWNWYLGAGGAVSGGVGTNGFLAAGPRVVLGLNTFTMNGAIEVFMQGAAQTQAMLSNGDLSILITIPLSAGMRLWY